MGKLVALNGLTVKNASSTVQENVLSVDSSGDVFIQPLVPTRAGSATAITYDTYLQTVNTYSVNAVGTSPAAPSSNGSVSIRYAVSNIGSNVDRIDVYNSDSNGTNHTGTLLNLAISGTITITQVGGGGHSEVYRIISVTNNTSYVSFAVSWVSGDNAAMSTITTDTFIFDADYQYELSRGFNRLYVRNDSGTSGTTTRGFRLSPPSDAVIGEKVIVEIQQHPSSNANVLVKYVLRSGTPTFRKDRILYSIGDYTSGQTMYSISLGSNDVAFMEFMVYDDGTIVGLVPLAAQVLIT